MNLITCHVAISYADRRVKIISTLLPFTQHTYGYTLATIKTSYYDIEQTTSQCQSCKIPNATYQHVNLDYPAAIESTHDSAAILLFLNSNIDLLQTEPTSFIKTDSVMHTAYNPRGSIILPNGQHSL